ncbi:MAG TPA: hypothetical protein VE971_00085 [Candidatus Eisenbacteria bacterium]|nr:hypothetical protein [Candidatus Eisenbacteria bacterium]
MWICDIDDYVTEGIIPAREEASQLVYLIFSYKVSLRVALHFKTLIFGLIRFYNIRFK